MAWWLMTVALERAQIAGPVNDFQQWVTCTLWDEWNNYLRVTSPLPIFHSRWIDYVKSINMHVQLACRYVYIYIYIKYLQSYTKLASENHPALVIMPSFFITDHPVTCHLPRRYLWLPQTRLCKLLFTCNFRSLPDLSETPKQRSMIQLNQDLTSIIK